MIKIKDFPKTLLVKGQSYSVKFVKKIPGHEGEALDGYCCYETQTLYIRLGQSPRERLSTAIHEALHAIDCEWDIKLDHRAVYALENALTALLADNGLIP